MTDFLLMTLEDEQAHASQSPKAMAELIEKSAAYVDDLRRVGRLKDSGRLRPSREGKRVRRDGDRLEVREGPFAEEGKALGSYHWIESSRDDAAEFAARVPVLPGDAIEVRPLIKGRVAVEKEAKPGKIFACAVLGNAKTEETWVDAMDRIDEETRGRLPQTPSFLGGLRLEPPTNGRRLATHGERRALFDGPFLESKEVIGGLFLVRMTSIDEVVRWAGDTPFVVHGVLEIREMWRI